MISLIAEVKFRLALDRELLLENSTLRNLTLNRAAVWATDRGVRHASIYVVVRMHALRSWRARASGVLLHGTGTPTAVEVTCVNNQRPSIFSASPLRFTWLLAVQNGRPVAGFNDTSK